MGGVHIGHIFLHILHTGHILGGGFILVILVILVILIILVILVILVIFDMFVIFVIFCIFRYDFQFYASNSVACARIRAFKR